MAETRVAKYVARARALWESQTDAESRLWSRLRGRNLLGFKFMRQQPVGPYVADFAGRERDLIVEVDGGQRADSQHDERRSAILAQHGYRVIRFWNNDVLSNMDGVLEEIAEALAKAPSPGLRCAKSDLSPKGEVAPGQGRATDPSSPFGGEVGALASREPSCERPPQERRVRGPSTSGGRKQ